jgi:putative endonuclease
MVAGKGHDLIFVEVKTRAKGGMSSPADGVTMEKRRRLARAAAEYLSRHKLWSRPCRFDLVLVAFTDDGKEPEIEHIENAFEVTDALGRRHASWQPW